MILLSLALIVASAVALAWGLFAANDPLIWVSLVAGLGAVALIAGSVVRHRRHPVADGVPDAGAATAGSAALGSASAGVTPAPSPTPYRPAPAPPADPVSPPGWPGAQTWPWATTPPGQSPDADSRSGWTGPVPAASPPGQAAPPDQVAGTPASPGPDAPAADTPAADAPVRDAPATAWADATAAPVESSWDRVAPGDTPADTPEGEPGVEEIAVRDALRVAQLPDEVVVVDGRPRYHLSDCPTLTDAQPIPLAVSVARRGGFTPCAICRPDAVLLARSRSRPASDTAERPSEGRQQL